MHLGVDDAFVLEGPAINLDALAYQDVEQALGADHVASASAQPFTSTPRGSGGAHDDELADFEERRGTEP